MEILKTNKKYKQNKFKYKNITIQKDGIIPSKVLANFEQYTIMEYTLSDNIQFVTEALNNNNNNNFLFTSKSFDDDLLITPVISRKIYQSYNLIILNLIKKYKLKIVKCRVINYGNVGLNGLIAPISDISLFINKKIKKKDTSSILKTLTFICENIKPINKYSKMKINVSRKKFTKLIKDNATI